MYIQAIDKLPPEALDKLEQMAMDKVKPRFIAKELSKICGHTISPTAAARLAKKSLERARVAAGDLLRSIAAEVEEDRELRRLVFALGVARYAEGRIHGEIVANRKGISVESIQAH